MANKLVIEEAEKEPTTSPIVVEQTAKPRGLVVESTYDETTRPSNDFTPARVNDATVYDDRDTFRLFPESLLNPINQLKLLGTLAPLLGERQNELTQGVGEAGMAVGSSLLSATAAGLIAPMGALEYKFMSTLPFTEFDQPADEVFMDITNGIRGQFTYVPRGETGQQITEAVGKTFGLLEKAGTFLGEEATDLTMQIRELAEPFGLDQRKNAESAALVGTMARLIPDAAAMLLMPYSVKRYKSTKAANLEKEINTNMRAAGVEEMVIPPNAKEPSLRMKWSALNDLPKDKPRFESPADMQKFVDDVSTGQYKVDIAVELGPGGIPRKVISGEKGILAMQIAEQKGFKPQSVTVRGVQPKKYTPSEEAEITRLADSATGKFLRNRAIEESGVKQALTLTQELGYALWDVQKSVKDALYALGEPGATAVRRLELAFGATPRAHMYFQDSRQIIYGDRGLDNPELSAEPFIPPNFGIGPRGQTGAVGDLSKLSRNIPTPEGFKGYKKGDKLTVIIRQAHPDTDLGMHSQREATVVGTKIKHTEDGTVIEPEISIEGVKADSILDFTIQSVNGRALKIPKGQRGAVGNLSGMSERDVFDQYVAYRRIAAIVGSRAKSKLPKTFEQGLTKEEVGAWLENLPKQLGEKRYANFVQRADDYFDSMFHELDRLREYGLISKKDFIAMRDIEYSPREWMSRLDPPIIDPKTGRTLDVGESGLNYLEKGLGKRGAIITDSESLLAEVITRTENRIARNYANQALYNIAGGNLAPNVSLIGPKGTAKIDQKSLAPDLVRLAKHKTGPKGGKVKIKPPRGFAEVNVRVGGKTETLWMDRVQASSWLLSDPQITQWFAATARLVSGSSLVKPLATGYNPGFAVTNMMVDLVHAWRSSEAKFSKWAPVYAGQIGSNLMRTFKDAATKEGAYKAFIEEGGGMSFLTHQGRRGFSITSNATRELLKPMIKRSKWSRNIQKVREYAGWFNETGEIWVRLAIRDRAIQNGMSPEAATHAARAYLDFSQGGAWTKGMDSFIPYLNASAQGLRTGLRAYKRKPIETGIKDIQLIAPYLAYEAYNWYKHPEVMSQLTAQQRRDNIIFPLPISITDRAGNRRFVVGKIKKDPSLLPILAIPHMMADRFFARQEPTLSTMDFLQATSPILQNPLPPTLSAFVNYAMNKDVWRNEDIWKGTGVPNTEFGDILPGAEFYGNTNEMFKMMGQLAPESISPIRTEQVFRTLAPTNAYLQMGYGIFNYGMSHFNQDPELKTEADAILEQSFLAWLSDKPVADRFLGLTHPGPNTYDRLDRASLHTATEGKLFDDQIRQLYENYTLARTDDKRKSLIDEMLIVASNRAAETMNPQLPMNVLLGNLAKIITTEKLSKIDDPYLASVAPPLWWSVLVNTGNEAIRADRFYEVWRDLDETQRPKLMSLLGEVDGLGRIKSSGKVIGTAGFYHEFALLKEQWGTSQIPSIVDPDAPDSEE